MARLPRLRLGRRLAGWAVIGGIVYLFDPTSGARRRARLRDVADSVRSRLQRPGDPPTDALDLAEIRRRLVDAIGDVTEFALDEASNVICGSCGTASPPATVEREWRHRLEGASDPAEMAVVSGLRCPACAARGMLSVPFGPQAEPRHADLLAHLPEPATDDVNQALAALR